MAEQHHHCDCEHSHKDENRPKSKYQQAFEKFNLHLHDEIVQEEVKKLLDENKGKLATPDTRLKLFGAIELTTLRVTDSQESVLKLVEKVNNFSNEHPELPHLATICVYPNFAKIVADSLEADGVEIA